MRYVDAMRLRSGDEVETKYTGEIVVVLQVIHDKPHREIYLLCDDGETYHHRAVK